MDFPKIHDPVHDDESIEQFGSLLNLDEMSFETCHQITKADAKLVNGRNVEEQLLKKVLILFRYEAKVTL